MTLKKKYTVKGKIFAYSVDPTSWYFIYVDKKDSVEIKNKVTKKVGFGFVPVEVTLKKMVRQKEGLFAGERITLTFRLL